MFDTSILLLRLREREEIIIEIVSCSTREGTFTISLARFLVSASVLPCAFLAMREGKGQQHRVWCILVVSRYRDGNPVPRTVLSARSSS